MLDFRHETFLSLCKTGSCTKTGLELHLTQPAVSQHLRYLEEVYGGKLLVFEGKKARITERGEKLRDFVQTMSADCRRMREEVSSYSRRSDRLKFGATLSIGEYVMPSIVTRLLAENPEIALTMEVNNTHFLLEKLETGHLDFALVEGFFDKNRYESVCFSRERFVAVASPSMELSGERNIEDLFIHRLIVREQGSGTRKILEQILEEWNYSLERFFSFCEIGNMNAIKELVAQGRGISFLYKVAAEKELNAGILKEIKIKNFFAEREFNCVFLKNSQYQREFMSRIEQFKTWSNNKK